MTYVKHIEGYTLLYVSCINRVFGAVILIDCRDNVQTHKSGGKLTGSFWYRSIHINASCSDQASIHDPILIKY